MAVPVEIPEAVAPPPRHPRFPLLDGMRAIAVLCVVVVHCALFGGAFSTSLPGRLLAHLNLGVTIFFLISGFLLYRPFIASNADFIPLLAGTLAIAVGCAGLSYYLLERPVMKLRYRAIRRS